MWQPTVLLGRILSMPFGILADVFINPHSPFCPYFINVFYSFTSAYHATLFPSNFDKIFWSHGLLIKLKARISKRLIYGEIFKPFTLTLEILDFLFFTLTELFNSFFGLSEKALANLLIVSLFSLVAFSQYKLCIYIVVNDWESQPPLR
jgi:hypothetical protein